MRPFHFPHPRLSPQHCRRPDSFQRKTNTRQDSAPMGSQTRPDYFPPPTHNGLWRSLRVNTSGLSKSLTPSTTRTCPRRERNKEVGRPQILIIGSGQPMQTASSGSRCQGFRAQLVSLGPSTFKPSKMNREYLPLLENCTYN